MSRSSNFNKRIFIFANFHVKDITDLKAFINSTRQYRANILE